MMIIKKYGFYILIAAILFAASSCGKKLTPSSQVNTGRGIKFDNAAFDYVYIEAIKQKLMGNAGDAIKYLEQCIRINPESDASYFQIGQILLSSGDINGGRKFLLKANELQPDNKWYLIMLAGTYYQAGKLDSAIFYYEKVARNYPVKEDVQMTLGSLYTESKEYEKAERIFEDFDRRYGVNDRSTLAAVKNFIMAGKFGDAYEKINLLLLEEPENLLYNSLLAEVYRSRGEKEKAREVFNSLIEKNPGDADLQVSLCGFLLDENKYEDLLALLTTIIINTDISREIKIRIFADIIDTEDLVEEFSNQIQVEIMILEATYPNDDIILLLRPELLIKAGKSGDAEERLNTIIRENPGNYYAWEKLLLLFLDTGQFGKLEERGYECATRFNRSFLAKMLYATGATENKNFDVALEELRKATILAGSEAEMLMQVLAVKADVYYRMKDYIRAFETFEEAIKTDDTDLTILNNYAYYLAEQDQKLKEAEIMAKKVIEKEKDNTTFLDTYGWVLYKRGKVREAEKVFERIIAGKGKPDAEWYEHYGYVLKKRRKCREAVLNWDIALKLDSTKSHLYKEIAECRK